jgi:hypothetical protein
MGGTADRMRLARKGRDASAHRRRLRTWPVSLDGDLEVLPYSGAWSDVWVCRHRWSGHVVFTMVVPVGVWSDLDMQQRTEVSMSFLQRPGAAVNGRAVSPSPPGDWQQLYPALVEYLFATAYEDGTARVPATLTMMAGDTTGLKCVLNDRAEQRSLWATGSDLEQCLEALDELLQSPSTPWRLDKGAGRGVNKK